jgi:hypothetical protein
LEEDAERAIESQSEEIQDSELEEEENKKKGRLRKRGPYRKAHANW